MSIRAQLLRLARGTLLYGLGGIANRFLSFLLLPLFTRYLTPRDYGINALLGIVTLALTGLFSLGTANSMGICYFECEDRTQRHRIVWTTALLVAVNAGMWCALGWVVAPWVSPTVLGVAGYEDVFRLAITGLLVTTVATPFQSYLRLSERARAFVLISLISTVLTLGLGVYLIIYLGRGLRGLIEAGLVAQSAVLLLTILVVAPELTFGFRVESLRPLLRIGFPSIFALGAFYVIDYADRAMLQRLVGTDEVGIYAMGYTFGLVMLVAVDAFGSAWPPYFVSFIKRRDEAQGLFGRIFQYYLLAFGSLTLLFFAFARPMLLIMTAPQYHAAFTVVGWVALAYLFKGCYLIMLPGLVFEKKLFIQSGIEWTAALLTIALNLLLIPPLRKDGAALTTSLAYFSLVISAWAVSRRYLAVRYDWDRIGRWCAGFAVAACLLSSLNRLGGLTFQILLASLVLAIYGVYSFSTALTASERASVLRLVWARKTKNGA